jgi:hypothetical protein
VVVFTGGGVVITGGGVVITGGGVGVGGVGDRLGAASVVEHVDHGVGAVSVLNEYFVLFCSILYQK